MHLKHELDSAKKARSVVCVLRVYVRVGMWV